MQVVSEVRHLDGVKENLLVLQRHDPPIYQFLVSESYIGRVFKVELMKGEDFSASFSSHLEWAI
jgi:hypothetical protein